MSEPRAVVFDIGKVLVNFDPALAVRNLAAATEADEALVEAALFAGAHYPAYSRGHVDGVAFHRSFAQALTEQCSASGSTSPLALSFKEFERGWCEMFWPLGGMDELAAEVASLVPVVLCSNTDPLHYRYLLATVPSLRLARAAVLSFEVGAEKPEPAIYEVLAQRVPAPRERTLFIDDRADNVAAAALAGFDAVLFNGPAALRETLRERGILVRALD